MEAGCRQSPPAAPRHGAERRPAPSPAPNLGPRRRPAALGRPGPKPRARLRVRGVRGSRGPCRAGPCRSPPRGKGRGRLRAPRERQRPPGRGSELRARRPGPPLDPAPAGPPPPRPGTALQKRGLLPAFTCRPARLGRAPLPALWRGPDPPRSPSAAGPATAQNGARPRPSAIGCSAAPRRGEWPPRTSAGGGDPCGPASLPAPGAAGSCGSFSALEPPGWLSRSSGVRSFCSLETFPRALGKFVTAPDPRDRSLWPLPRLVPVLNLSHRRSSQDCFHGLASLSAGLLWPLSLSSTPLTGLPPPPASLPFYTYSCSFSWSLLSPFLHWVNSSHSLHKLATATQHCL